MSPEQEKQTDEIVTCYCGWEGPANRLPSHNNQIHSSVDEIEQLRAALDAARAENDGLTKQKAEFFEQFAKLRDRIQQLETENGDLQAGIHGYIADVHSAKRALKTAIEAQGEQFKLREQVEVELKAVRAAAVPGTQEAIVSNMFKLAQKLGHNPISSEHALTFLREYIQYLQAANAELQESLDTVRAERVREKSIYADECAERQMWEARAKVLEAELEAVRAEKEHFESRCQTLDAALFSAHHHEDIAHETNRAAASTIQRLEAANAELRTTAEFREREIHGYQESLRLALIKRNQLEYANSELREQLIRSTK